MDYVSEDSAVQHDTDVEQLQHRVELLEEDNTILRNMLQRQNNGVQHLQGLPQERLAQSHDKLQNELNKEKNRRQTADNLLDTSRREFEKAVSQQAYEVRRQQDANAVLRAENDVIKTKLRDAESMILALRKDNDHLRIDNDALRFQQRKTDKKDPHAPFVHRNGPVPFSQVLRALNGSTNNHNHKGNISSSRNTGRSTSSAQQGLAPEEYRFVDANARSKSEAANNAVTTARSRVRSTSPYQQTNNGQSGSRSRHALLDVKEGGRVTWQAHQGIIRYIGPVDDLAAGEWIGVELVDGTMGDHGGCYAGRQYFVCSRRTGVFCRASDLSAPRLLDQFPAEPRQGGASSSRSASLLTSGALRSASYNTNNTEDLSQQQQQGNGNGNTSHRSKSHQQHRSASARSRNSQRSQSPYHNGDGESTYVPPAPVSPRKVSREEYEAAEKRVQEKEEAVEHLEAESHQYFAEHSADLKGLLNLVKPAEIIQDAGSTIALSLHLAVNRDIATNKEIWDRSRAARMLEKMTSPKLRRSVFNEETAEFIETSKNWTDADTARFQRCGAGGQVLYTFFESMQALTGAVNDLKAAKAELAGMRCDEEEKTAATQEEEEAQQQPQDSEKATAEPEQQQQQVEAIVVIDVSGEQAVAAAEPEQQQEQEQVEAVVAIDVSGEAAAEPEQKQEQQQEQEQVEAVVAVDVSAGEPTNAEPEQKQQEQVEAIVVVDLDQNKATVEPVSNNAEGPVVESSAQETVVEKKETEVEAQQEQNTAAAAGPSEPVPQVEQEQQQQPPQQETPAVVAPVENVQQAEKQQEQAAPAPTSNGEQEL